MMLRAPYTLVEATPAEALSLKLPATIEARTKTDTLAALQRLSRDTGELPVSITVLEHVPEHVGLGSKTALVLAVLKAAVEVVRRDVSEHDLKRYSGRGGTSGVGVHGFFTGGLVADAGQDRASPNDQLVPSSSASPQDVSLVVSSRSIPKNWHINVLVPAGIRRNREQEMAFFAENTPVPEEEILQVLAAVHHGIVPAVAKADLLALTASLRLIHGMGFKRRALDGQAAGVRKLYVDLCEAGLGAVGMSSMGPAIYVITDSATADQRIRDITTGHRDCLCFTTRARNTGFDIE